MSNRETYLRRVAHYIADKLYPYSIAVQMVEIATKNLRSSINTNYDPEHIEESAEESARKTIQEFYRVTSDEYTKIGYPQGIKYLGGYLVTY